MSTNIHVYVYVSPFSGMLRRGRMYMCMNTQRNILMHDLTRNVRRSFSGQYKSSNFGASPCNIFDFFPLDPFPPISMYRVLSFALIKFGPSSMLCVVGVVVNCLQTVSTHRKQCNIRKHSKLKTWKMKMSWNSDQMHKDRLRL